MTVSTSLFTNTVDSISGSFSDQRLSDRASLIALFQGMLPISKETIDRQGNRSRLWVLHNAELLGTTVHPDRKISCVPAHKIINPCSSHPISWKSLKSLQGRQFELAYIPEQNKLLVFPHLQAAGKDAPIAKVVEKSLRPKPPASWTPPPFNEAPEKLGHIFRNADGHLSKDTPENRAYILGAVSDPANKKAINKFGKEMYFKVMPDGYQAWAHVKNGVITNGGRAWPWIKWVAKPKTHPGGKMQPRNIYISEKFIFQERIQAECITTVYNASTRKPPWQPHPAEAKRPTRDVGGVRHQTGLILDLLKELEEGVYDEYMFFLPTTEGKTLLRKEEILQIVREIAQGIYIHDTLPFFSLNVNTDHQLYPVIHPAYQNTYVGYVISMLDYYLKAFWSGQLFEEEFIAQWHTDPTTEEEFLREQSFSMQEFVSFPVILQNVLKQSDLPVETIVSLSHYPVTFSCRIIGQQKQIQKTDNLFILDADVELVHTVEWEPVGEEQKAHFRILDQACGMMCEQIKTKGFALPVMKKWLEALKIMNFFSCYFRTLQEGDQIPRFEEKAVVGQVCPPIFPPIPYSHGPFVAFPITDVLAALSWRGKKALHTYCQTLQATPADKASIRSLLIPVLQKFSVKKRSDQHLSEEELLVFVDRTIDTLRMRYCSLEKQIKQLIDLTIKRNNEETLSKQQILSRVDRLLTQTQEEILRKNLFTFFFPRPQQTYSVIRHWLSLTQGIQPLAELKKEEKIYQQILLWFKDPFKLLTQDGKWFFDLEDQTLTVRRSEGATVFGGYEPTLEDRVSQPSALAADILNRHRQQLSEWKEEEFFPVGKNRGQLFKLPVEPSFPLSSHGIPYQTMMLMPPLNHPADAAFLAAIHAIEKSNEAAFQSIEQEILDWNRLDPFGKHLLHYAAAADSSLFLKTLIDKKVQLLTQDTQGWTPLHYAAGMGNLSNLELLLSAETRLLNLPALHGESPVYVAVQKNQLSCVEKLVQAGADLSLKPTHGWNVLMSAIYHDHEEMALLLLNTGKIDLEYAWRGGKTALHFAIEMQMEHVLKQLLQLGVNQEQLYHGQDPLSLAKEQNWLKGVELLTSSMIECQNSCSIM